MKIWKHHATRLAGSIVIALLYSCATLPGSPSTSSLVVTYAATKVIEAGETSDERLQRAQRIKTIVGEARTWLKGDRVTIGSLETAARARLAKLKLAPVDAALANTLVQIAVQDLHAKIGAGVISPDQLVTVNQMLDWIESAAELHGA